MRPEGGRPAPFDQRDELRSGPYPKDDLAFWSLICLPLQVGQLQVPFERALESLGGFVAHMTQETASAAGVHRIELEREAVRVVEIDAVDRFALPQNCLRRSLNFRESSQYSIDIEIRHSPTEVRETCRCLPNALRVSLRQRHVCWSVSNSENRLASAVILKGMDRHSNDASVPLDSLLQIITTEAYVVQSADAYR